MANTRFMADGCRLPKVIVVLALLSRISCSIALQRYDDLLDRVRESKSNEPEVRDFLRSVLKHHNDFRWISHEAFKGQSSREGRVLPLKGVNRKNKRSYYAKSTDTDEEEFSQRKPVTRYVYRHDTDFNDDEDHEINENNDVQSFASNPDDSNLQSVSGNDVSNQEQDNQALQSKSMDEKLDFDGPVNDVYPYEEDHEFNVPQDSRFARDVQDTFLYDDHNFDDDDLLEGSPEVGRGEADEQEQEVEEFASGVQRRAKRALDAEALLNEKIMLQRVLHNPIHSINPRPSPKEVNDTEKYFRRELVGDDLKNPPKLNSVAYHMPGDAIEVIPSSQTGVHYAPGVRFEKYGEFGKSEQDQYNQEDLEDLQQAQPKLSKRKCSETLVETDFKVPELFEANKSKQLDIDQPLSEFYYSIPHDVIGLNQDVSGENRDIGNVSCKKFKRSSDFDEDDGKSKKKKSIKIKIIDNDELVKDIEKTKGGNSVVLTIKKTDNDEPCKTGRSGFDDITDDDTLKKIDTIIKHDQASLRSYKQAPAFDRQEQSQDNDNQQSWVEHNHKHNKNYHRIHEIATTDVSLLDFDRIEYPDGSLDTFPESYFKTTYKQQPENTYQNRLEDQTEPTSAAEQRELGKINNNIHTEAINMKTTTEKVFIIPLKKEVDGEMILTQPEEDDLDQNGNMLDQNLQDSDDIVNNLQVEDQTDDDRGLVKSLDLGDTPEDVGKRSKLVRYFNGHGEVRNDQNPLKADAFRSRKLFSLSNDNMDFEESHDPEEPDIEESKSYDGNVVGVEDERDKKDVRNALGMQNDQDYNEDKIDVFGDVEKSTKKPGKVRIKSVESKRENDKIRQHLLASIINTQQERRALKARLAKTKNMKVKKDVSKMRAGNDIEHEDLDSGNRNYQHLIVKDFNDDNLQSRGKSKHNVLIKSNKDNLDRCCENSDKQESSSTSTTSSVSYSSTMSTTSIKIDIINDSDNNNKEHEDNQSKELKESIKLSNNGNELDIIEKTQAILLHFTGLPPNQQQVETSTREDLKLDDDRGVGKAENGELSVKSINSYKTQDGVKDPENVVSEIIQLVQNYKNKVNEYNKNNNLKVQNQQDQHNQQHQAVNNFNPKHYNEDSIKSKSESWTSLPDIEKDKKELYEEQLNSKTQYDEAKKKLGHSVLGRYPGTSSTLLSEEDGDASFRGHAAQKYKKLHPNNDTSKKCEVNSDNDFVMPAVLQEGYVKPEVVADDNKKRSNIDGRNVDINDMELETKDFQVNTDDNHISYQKRSDGVDGRQLKVNKHDKVYPENPMSFTPDTLDNFKDIVESGLPTNGVEGQDISKRDLFNPELEYDNIEHDFNKREVNNDYGEYSDEEIDKLLDMVDDNSSNIKSDQNLLKRYRRYKNFEPFLYQSFPRFRHGDDLNSLNGLPSSTSDGLSALTESTIPTSAPACGDIERKQGIDNDLPPLIQHKKHKKKSHSNQCMGNNEDDGYDTCKSHKDKDLHPKTKAQLALENRQREHVKGQINDEQLVERQKEQEHIKNVLNGHLLLEVMDKFDKRVKENQKLNHRFGQAMGKKCAADQVNLIDRFKEEQTKADVRHAQLMLHQVIVLMNKIVAEQVHRRTCLILSPTLKAYLRRTAVQQKNTKSSVVAEGYPLPAVKGVNGKKDNILDDVQGDFLFSAEGDDDTSQSPLEAAAMMRKKIHMIKALLSKYNHMSHMCQIKVQPVHDYLKQHLKALEKMYSEKQWGDIPDMCEVACNLPNSTAADLGLGNSTTASLITSSKSGQSDLPCTIGLEVISPTTESGKDKLGRDVTVNNTPKNINRMFRPYDDSDSNVNIVDDRNPSEYPSEKYKNLVEAAAVYRRKRQIEERLARLFGHSKQKEESELVTTTITEDESKMEEDAEPDLSNVAFEAPTVYQM